eukprot:gene6003-6075_t
MSTGVLRNGPAPMAEQLSGEPSACDDAVTRASQGGFKTARWLVQDGLASSGAMAQAEAIYTASQGGVPSAAAAHGEAALPRGGLDPNAEAGSVTVPAAQGGRAWLRKVALALYRVVRPVARPLAWRARGFLQRDVLHRLQEISANQSGLLTLLQQIEARSGSLPGPATVRQGRSGPGLPRRKVHQFHAGSATGDAITNAMFLLQRELRAWGYDSEIFVEHVAEGLQDRLHGLDALPLHDDHVLLVHHSMGHAGFERMLASPAPKVLIYHNITPPALLAFNPFLQQAAEQGRRQLSVLRGHVVAALADSAFNAVELHRLGFSAPREAPLLFDVERLIAGAKGCARRETGFVVLFVGREVPSKGQAALVVAFAAFEHAYRLATGLAAELVLAGAGGSDAAAYRGEILRLIGFHGLEGKVRLTGALSDADLRQCFADADLYVSLSRHEGFGVPLVEAMAAGIPVLALRAGAVPGTLGGAGILVEADAPDLVAAEMLALACNPGAREAVVAGQFAVLDRYRLSRHLPVLMEALLMSGAAPPRAEAPVAALRAGMSVVLTGDGRREATLGGSLDLVMPGRVDRAGPEAGLPAGDPCGPRVTIALDAIRLAGVGDDLALAMLPCPLSLVPRALALDINAGFDGVLVSSDAACRAVVESGVRVPVRVVGEAVSLPSRGAGRAGNGVRRFVHVSDGGPECGTDLLLAAWARAFCADDGVQLAIYAGEMASGDAARGMLVLREGEAEAAEVVVLAAAWAGGGSDAVLVQPSRTERPSADIATALALGMRVIATCRDDAPPLREAGGWRALRHRMRPANLAGAHPHALWAEADIEDLVEALRAAAVAAPVATIPSADLLAFDGAGHGERVIAAALDILQAPPVAGPFVAWVSPWNVRCGIAQYSRHLLGAFDLRGRPGMLLLSDHRPPVGEIAKLPGLRVEPVFRVGEIGSVPGLACAIMAEDPDVVVVQHQAGVLPWEALAALLEHPAMAPRCVVVALHNGRDLLRAALELRARVIAALNRASRVLVHAAGDVGLLGDIGVANAVWLPHGSTRGPAPRAPSVVLAGDAPLIGSTGFVLPHKGLQRLIAAIGLLVPSWPGIRLRLVTSRYPDPVSDVELAECEALVRQLRLDAHVEWHTEFAPNELVLHRLSACDLLVMPYAPTLESSSGAVRQALASGVPTLVSDLPLFDDLGDAVERLPSSSAEAIAARIDALLRQPAARAALQGRAQDWLADHDWELVAERLQGMLWGLHRQRLEGMRLAESAMAFSGGWTPSGIGHS